MFEQITKYRGQRIHLSPDGDDNNSGSCLFPVQTFAEAEYRLNGGCGDIICAGGDFGDQTTSWASEKQGWALVGGFSMTAKMSGWAIDITSPDPFDPANNPFSNVYVTGAVIILDTAPTGGIRIRNRAATIIEGTSVFTGIGVTNKILYSLETDESANVDFCGGNKFLYTKAFGFNSAGNIGYRLFDDGNEPNELAYGTAAKMGTGGAGVQIGNVATDAVHGIHHMNLQDNPVGRDFIQVSPGHHWSIKECYSDQNPDNNGDGIGDIIPYPASGYDTIRCDIMPMGDTAALNARMLMRQDDIWRILGLSRMGDLGKAGKIPI